MDLKKGLKFSLSQLAAQLNQAAGTDPEKRKIADKVVLAIDLIVKRKSSLDERIFNMSPILSQVSANARETAIFLNNDISADEDTKCLYLRLDDIVGFNFKVVFSILSSLDLTNHSCSCMILSKTLF